MTSSTLPTRPHETDSTEKLWGREWRTYVDTMAAVSAKARVDVDRAIPDSAPQRSLVGAPSTREVDVSAALQAALSRNALDRRAKDLWAFRVSGLQKWEGTVLEVWGDMFTAQLISHDNGPSVLADFNLSSLGGEREVSPGDIIYVTVRDVAGAVGLSSRTSAVRLQRLGRWTTREVAAQRERAAAALAEVAEFIEQD